MNLQNQNILFIVRTMGLGGTENVVLQLCEILSDKVNKIVVCSSGGVHEKKLHEMGIKHYLIPDIASRNPMDMLKSCRSIKSIIDKEQITIVHSHHRMAAFYAELVAPKSVEKVANLPRTEGISSSEVRSEQCKLRMGIVGKAAFRTKFVAESKYVNGVDVIGVCASQKSEEPEFDEMFYTENYDELLEKVDAVYIVSKPEKHYIDTKKALLAGKHVLCESPIALKEADCEELYSIAEEHGLVLMDAIKTAYSTAYERLVLLAKSGKIGKVVSVDAVCTSLRDGISIAGTDLTQKWNSMCGWAPAALLPVFQILGTGYRKKVITTKFLDEAANMDAFTKIDFTYDDAVASIKVAKAAKSEGELVVTGTKGYIYVPAPWWKTDYFEVRYENSEDNQRFFYQLDGEGIRYEIVAFAKSIEVKKPMNYVEKGVSKSIAKIIESFNDRTDMIVI